MSQKISITEVSRRLSEDAFNVAKFLLPEGKQKGDLLEVGGVNGHSGKSLKVHIQGAHAGKWRDWADTEHGDLLDLWAATRNITPPEALREAKRYLNIRDEPLREVTYSKPIKEHAELAANGRAFNWITGERKIPAAIVNRYKVRGCSEKNAVVFPSYSPKGELLNHSYRTLDAEKKVWQDKGCAPSLWGWHALSQGTWEKREILICEGQIDAMSWAAWGIEALSIPNGGGRTWIEHDWENLEVFTTIYLSFDMDGKSDENLRETIQRLGKHRCRVVRIDGKDANECLKAGKNAENAALWLKESQFVGMPHLVSADKFSDQVVDQFFPKPGQEGVSVEPFIHKDKTKSFYFRNGEVTLWTGTTGHGKSTLLNYTVMMLGIMRHEPALIITLEMPPPMVIHRQICAAGMNPGNPEDVKTCVAAVSRIVMFYDKVGVLKEAELFEVIAYARARHGVRDIVIDSLMRMEGMEEDHPKQTDFVTRLSTVAKESGCHIHLVCHPRKSAGDEAPKSQDISGSGNMRNNADNVISVWRNVDKERKAEDGEDVSQMPDSIVYIEKDRIMGILRKFPLGYDAQRFRFSSWVAEPRATPTPTPRRR